MKNAIAIAGLFSVSLASVAIAQPASSSPAAFEVASIRPSAPGEGRRSQSHGNPSEVLLRNMTLKRLVEIAYQVEDFGVIGPDWTDTLRFDLNAKIPEGATRDQYPEMLKTLLVQRFKLTVHRETKIVAGYAMVTAKGGPKLQAAQSDDSSSNDNHGRFVAQAYPLSEFREWLSRSMNAPVADKTGLTGKFDFTFEYSPDSLKPLASDKPSDDSRPSIFDAMQDKLGLKLTPQKIPVEIVVVDHIERVPSEN